MIRQNIILGNYIYNIDLLDAYSDLKNSQYTSKFVMLRNVRLINDIVEDQNVYIIDKELYEATKDNTENIVWPSSYNSQLVYSTQINEFDSDLTIGSFKTYDIYHLYNVENIETIDDIQHIKDREDLTEANILCDKIRIYHPSTKTNQKFIVHVYAYMNNIKFHFYCRTIDNIKNDFGVNSETEFKVDKTTYSEYVEFYIPNIHYMFGLDKDTLTPNIYFIEDLNNVISEENSKFVNKNFIFNEDLQLLPLKMMLQPSRIVNEEVDGEIISVKQYINVYKGIEDVHPINITLFPYKGVNTTTHHYELDGNMDINSDVFVKEHSLKIQSHLGFNNGVISIISTFDYPNKDKFKSDDIHSGFYKAYRYYNGITDSVLDLYNNVDDSIENTLYTDVNKLTINDFTDEDQNMVKDFMENASSDEVEALFTSNITTRTSELTDAYDIYKSYNSLWNDSTVESIIDKYKARESLRNLTKSQLYYLWISMKRNAIRQEYEEVHGTQSSFLGFRITIASSFEADHIIYNHNELIDIDDIDDFSFSLNNIFTSYSQMPEKLIVRIYFLDKILNSSLLSNYVVITKEWYKYMVADYPEQNKQYCLFKNNAAYKEKHNDCDMKKIDLTDNTGDKINFINNFTCIVENISEETKQPVTGSTSHKVLLQPIFYRVADLQNIRIRSRVTQNIGINVANYMTKVEIFKLIINDVEYIESGRNDIYVIFKVNASDLTTSTGTYDLLNEDDEYISSGNYTLY